MVRHAWVLGLVTWAGCTGHLGGAVVDAPSWDGAGPDGSMPVDAWGPDAAGLDALGVDADVRDGGPHDAATSDAVMLDAGALDGGMDRAPVRTVGLDEPVVRWTGRWDRSGPTPRCNFIGCGIALSVDAGEVRLGLVDGREAGAATWDSRTNSVAVYVDGVRTRLIDLPRNASTEIVIASGLVGRHLVEVRKASEAMRGVIAIQAIRLLDALPPRVPAARRRIEVIGDSITCGAGNLHPPPCPEDAQVHEDGSLAYSLVLAERLGAEATAVCQSGVRAQDDAFRAETDLALGVRSLFALPSVPYSTPSDLVVVNLGTNDGADSPGYRAAMNDILDRARRRSPSAWIVLMHGPMTMGFGPALEAVAAARGDGRISVLGVPFDVTARVGCTAHPNVEHHADLAARLEAHVRERGAW